MIYQQFLTDSLQEAAAIATSQFGKVSGVIKGSDNNQVLTETDLAIGKLLVEKVKQTYPTYNIIDEEAGVVNNGSEYTWVIDPIDGTSNFANAVPTYGIMMGLLKGDTPIAGGIALPSFSTIISAEKEEGTFSNKQKISVTDEPILSNVLLAYGIDGHPESPELTKKETTLLTDIILNIRNLRTSNSAYDYVAVANGQYGGVLNQTSKIWDNVAAQIVIEEAGGTYTDYWGKPIDYTEPLSKSQVNYTFCAAAPLLHEQLQKIIHNKS